MRENCVIEHYVNSFLFSSQLHESNEGYESTSFYKEKNEEKEIEFLKLLCALKAYPSLI